MTDVTTTQDEIEGENADMKTVASALTHKAGRRFQHSPQFRRRRAMNWLTLGFTYSAMYMGRYNLSFANASLSKSFGWDKTQVGTIISSALLVYGLSAMFNGPISDRIGGRKSMLIGACGTAFSTSCSVSVLTLGF